MTRRFKDETLCLIGGYEKETQLKHQCFAPPLYQTVTYPLPSGEKAHAFFDDNDPYTQFIYSRRHNPTTDFLEKRLTLLEGAADTLCSSSGMGAIHLISTFFLDRSGAECVWSNRVYSRSFETFARALPAYGVACHMVEEPTDLNQWDAKLKKGVKMAFLESPTNPGLLVLDIKKIAEICRDRGVHLVVDNTLATPVATKPVELGASVSVESTSKYISGNGTVLGGSASVARAEWIEAMRRSNNANYGASPSPFNSWLCLMGLETLSLRMARHTENALAVARFLAGHPKVAQVNYPGLEEHPQHELAKAQMRGVYGGLLSFCLKDQSWSRVFAFLDALKLVVLAIHESAARSIVTHPASTNFFNMSKEELERAGVPRGLIRLSVGLESLDDLLEDLEEALRHA